MGYYDFPHTRNYDTDLGYLIDWFKTNKNKIEENTAITIEKALSASEDAIKAYNSATNASNSAKLALELKNQTELLKNLMQDEIDQINTNTRRINNLATIDQGSITTTADAELVDIRVAYNGTTYSSAGDSVRKQVSELKYLLDPLYKFKNLADSSKFTHGKAVNKSGTILESSNYFYTDRIMVTAGDIISFTGSRFVTAYIHDIAHSELGADEVTTYTVPEEVEYIIITGYEAISNQFMVNYGDKVLEYIPYNQPQVLALEPIVEYETSPNLFKFFNCVSGFISDKNGSIAESSSYFTSNYIKVKSGVSYALSGHVRKLLCYTNNKERIDSTYVESETVDTIYTIPTNAEYIRISVHTDYLYEVSVVESNKISDSYISAFDRIGTLYNYNGNVLAGKKYVACGDSFTEGVSGEVFEDGIYKGKNKVYPYFIGTRNNMYVVNEAVSGSTMTNLGRNDAFSVNRYTNIPNDADYITIHLGINDDNVHQNAPIGSVDDETNTTFCGAWNIVLRYLITNHPKAKIGIIIPYGAETSYCNVVKTMAQRWGLGYLDLTSINSKPYVIRAYGKETAMSEEAINIRMNQWRVSATDLHPNGNAHEYISTIVENWLRSL